MVKITSQTQKEITTEARKLGLETKKKDNILIIYNPLTKEELIDCHLNITAYTFLLGFKEGTKNAYLIKLRSKNNQKSKLRQMESNGRRTRRNRKN